MKENGNLKRGMELVSKIAKYTVYGWLHMISLIGVIILGLVIGIAALGSWLSGLLFGRKKR